MLAHLSVNNFAIVKSLQLELSKGMTTITGETGAGKSIAIDALGLCLGGRADAGMVRQGEEKTEVSAAFLLDNNLHATRWLEDNDLLDGSECILRRIITKEGRSRAFINGSPVPLSQLKSLGQLLINIHGQHAHHQLMKSEHQMAMLDQYAGHLNLLKSTRSAYQHWRQADNNLKQLKENSQQNQAQKQLLEYQIKELNELSLGEEEFAELEQEHKRLSNSGELATTCQQAIELIYEGEEVNALGILQSANHSLIQLAELDEKLSELPNMLSEAMIQLEETKNELRSYLDGIDVDPARMAYVEERFSKVMSVARKHHVMPEELYQHHQDLLAQVEALDCSDERLDELAQEVEHKYQSFLTQAEKLHKSRSRYAKELNKLITQSMHELSMEKAVFSIEVSNDNTHPSPLGMDSVCFLVSTNPGQPLQPIAKVASGGELSRISLAIQVITAQKVDTPSLIFDEVDVGISGPTAAVVGKMLRKLGESTQVLCVTHLPQVAGCGHQQMFVAKQTKAGQTETQMHALDEQQRVAELARLLGGSQITDSTLANAKELLIAA
ncbi:MULTISPECIES: DNA repair protein RecN [Vibrio]|jgi:DNA repair protein RecN (Recombination protein N)|uniref:DNA repair protein RecN n=2 Tax=Vibrio alginolyticus TaxID=663 RepID=A0A0L8DBG9_VIBAL|nr:MULTISPECIES: DNA repair protein RecN [Vibrio]EEZ84413.1 DNA repair protein RecN [Vibrio alginolyticus 40B]MDW1810161.1 DNA repair protein RecN [Vibrio sp. Vb2362]MDW1971576.1 DNA repair protein RecN [Vibrio sp. 945]MDW2295482.1 DNA repair protein RecN [Vibrio sp. 1404]QCO85176.1 DNA repair protein RecN [Vibrio neocaledonicus]QIR87743.1 DNA repair protein RecN [Vibrio diabolicus]